MKWNEFADVLARRRDAGRPVEFWWRDDDAMQVCGPVKRLVGLSRDHGVPLALAVVPMGADAGLFELLHDGVAVLQHGTDHRNRAGAGEKKTEYPQAEPAEAALERIAQGLRQLQVLGRNRVLPVLAPPWNRMRKDLLRELRSVGLHGLSGYGPRPNTEPAPGLRQVNTHVDIVAWRGGKRFIGESEALDLAARSLTLDEPIGWLTHHAVHDAAAWDFLERLFTQKAAHWLSAPEAFSYTAPAHG